MTQSINKQIQDYFSQGFKNALAINLDEPVPAISRSIQAIVPTILTAISDKARKSKESAERIIDLAADAATYYPKAPDVAKLQNDEEGSSLPVELFGQNEIRVARHVAAWSGVRPSSSEQLIAMAAPVVMGIVGENYTSMKVSPHEVHSRLNINEAEVSQMLPEGYELPDADGNVFQQRMIRSGFMKRT